MAASGEVGASGEEGERWLGLARGVRGDALIHQAARRRAVEQRERGGLAAARARARCSTAARGVSSAGGGRRCGVDWAGWLT